MRYIVVFGLLVMSLASCRGPTSPREVTEIQAMDIADVYVAQHYPSTPRNMLRPVAHDQGATWIVTYDAPEGAAGGTPTIVIDKRTSRVVFATHGQ